MNHTALKTKRKELYATITKELEAGVNPIYETWADQLIKGREPNRVLAALLSHCFHDELCGKRNEKDPAARDTSDDVRLFVGLGKRDGLTARSLITMVLEKVPIKAKQITGIHILDTFAFMTMPAHKAAHLVACYEGQDQPPLITYEKKRSEEEQDS